MPWDNSSYYRQLGMIRSLGNYDEQPRINTEAIRRRVAARTAEMQRQQPSFSTSIGSKGGSSFERFIRAISGQESGGNYRAVNRDSGAAGKYQLMPGNVSAWSREILGRSISMQQYLNSPRLQEQIARAKLQQYVNKYGYAGAAAAWYGGPGAVKRMHSTKPQGRYPSISQYVQQILDRM